MTEKTLSIILLNIFKREIKSVNIKGNEVVIVVNPTSLKLILLFLRDNSLFECKQLLDIFAVDYPNQVNRFEINYLLLSVKKNIRFLIRINANSDSYIESITSVFKSSNWLEREVWDLFGIYFYNHPDLRRILTDYGFYGHPLRKDFPLTGYLEVRYDDEEKRVVLEPLEITQEFRYFDFKHSWE